MHTLISTMLEADKQPDSKLDHCLKHSTPKVKASKKTEAIPYDATDYMPITNIHQQQKTILFQIYTYNYKKLPLIGN